jgi:valyl-tRNA synthetase
MALNAPLPWIVVYSNHNLETLDLQGVANSAVESRIGEPEIEMRPIEIKPQMKVLGPKFKDKSAKIIKALLLMDLADVNRQRASGAIRVDIGEGIMDVDPEAVEVVMETLSAGSAVDVLRVGAATVLVKR